MTLRELVRQNLAHAAENGYAPSLKLMRSSDLVADLRDCTDDFAMLTPDELIEMEEHVKEWQAE